MIFDSKFPLATDNNSGMCWTHDPCRVTLQVFADPYDNRSVGQLYQSVIDLVDPSLKLFHETAREVPVNNINNNCLENGRHQTPCLAVMLFLRGSDTDGNIGSNEDKFRLQKARQLFQHPPWRFHHAEKVSQGHINALPQNSQDFYCTEAGLPLWALRQVHYGRQHIRYVLYTQEESWPDQIQFYSLLFGLQPELLREDFCLFTMYANEDYDVQFALKKQSGSIRQLDSVHVEIKVKDIGQLVPLFPNVCQPISDTRWKTTDHDGNIVVLNLIKTSHEHVKNKRSSRKANCTPDSVGQLTSHCPPVHTSYNNKLNLFHSEDSDFYSLTSSSEDFCPNTGHHTYSNMVNTEMSSKFIFESTSSDLDIDLPLVHRHKQKEEDETSLTLTTTSEESGIQMHHCSDDTSYCDDDSLKPCLSATSKHRDVKLKVRFKDEVQTFSDDTISQHSSGIDSEEQSDSEMETKFSFTPLNKAHLHDSCTQDGEHCRENMDQWSCPKMKTLYDNKHQFPSTRLQGNNTLKNEVPSVKSHLLISPPSSNHVNLKISHNNNISPNSDKVFHQSVHQSVSHKQCHNKITATAVKKDNTHSINQDTNKNRLQASKQFCDLKLSDDPTVMSHSMSRSPSKIGGQVQPPPPPVRDINTRLRSVSCSEQKGSNLVLDPRMSSAKDNNTRPRSVSCSDQKGPHLFSKQNGQRNFYFEFTPTTSNTISNSALTQVKNDQHQSKSLQFTLKYDSGLSSGQEQVGFYV